MAVIVDTIMATDSSLAVVDDAPDYHSRGGEEEEVDDFRPRGGEEEEEPPPEDRHPGVDETTTQKETEEEGENGATAAAVPLHLDCYPYTFSPLLLFAEASYFDKGYSNYNSVAQFFASVIAEPDMLHNVLYERKDMLYEELLEHCLRHRMLIVCCIDAHFTACQILRSSSNSNNKQHAAAIYYDPCSPDLRYVEGTACRTLLAFLLLKCSYGDNAHVQEHPEHYTSLLPHGTQPVRRVIYQLWRKIHTIRAVSALQIPWKTARLDTLRSWVLVNDAAHPESMSTQLTANTCYFQVFL